VPFPSPRPFRKKANWLAALGTEAGAPILRGWARVRTGTPTPPREWRKALIIGDNHIGDLLYRSASIEHLKRGLPNCEFHYLAAPGPQVVIEGNPALASILPWMKSDSPLDLAPEHFAQLAAMKFDAALCTNCIKYWPELLLAIRLGIPNRVAYPYKGFSGWATFPIPIRYPQPFAAYFRDYVAALTRQPANWPTRPVIFANDRDQQEAADLISKLNITKPAVACFPLSRQPFGLWPIERFGETLRALQSLRDIDLLLCAGPGDGPALEKMNADFSLNAHVIPGTLGIRALSCFLKSIAAVLTADSGPRHISNAAGARVFFVRNVWFNAVEAGPYVDTETDLCGPPHDGDRGDGHALLAAINPNQVATLIASSL
jgi:ADP-heptose:LPS heptosyltransferase